MAFGSSLLTYSVLAQVITKTIGTPSCDAFNDLQGNHCYELKCDPHPDEFTNYDSCDGKPMPTPMMPGWRLTATATAR